MREIFEKYTIFLRNITNSAEKSYISVFFMHFNLTIDIICSIIYVKKIKGGDLKQNAKGEKKMTALERYEAAEKKRAELKQNFNVLEVMNTDADVAFDEYKPETDLVCNDALTVDALLRNHLGSLKHEEAWSIFCKKDGDDYKVVSIRKESVGDVRSVSIAPTKIAKAAAAAAADGVWMIHNHPNGYTKPSSGDFKVMNSTEETLKDVGRSKAPWRKSKPQLLGNMIIGAWGSYRDIADDPHTEYVGSNMMELGEIMRTDTTDTETEIENESTDTTENDTDTEIENESTDTTDTETDTTDTTDTEEKIMNGYITIKNSNSPTFESISQIRFDEIRNNLFHLNGRPVVMADIFTQEQMVDVQTLMDVGIHIDDARVVKMRLEDEGKEMYAAAKADYERRVAEAEIVAQKCKNLRGDFTYAITDKVYEAGSLTMNGAAKGIEIDDFTMFTVTVYEADMLTEVAKFQEVNHFNFEEWLFENGYITRTRSTENCILCGMYIAEEYGGVCERHPEVEQVIEYSYEPTPSPTADDEPF